MRFTVLLAPLLLAACSQSPQGKQIDALRDAANKEAEEIEAQADRQADPLDDQAKALREQAKQTGGFDGKRLEVQADAMGKQADLLREQAEEQAEAVRAAANAKVQALESR